MSETLQTKSKFEKKVKFYFTKKIKSEDIS